MYLSDTSFLLKEDVEHDYAVKMVRQEVEQYRKTLERNRTQYKIVDEAEQSTLSGAELNIILDPIFIFVFRWGMMIFACVNKTCFIFLQAMGKAAASTALSMI